MGKDNWQFPMSQWYKYWNYLLKPLKQLSYNIQMVQTSLQTFLKPMKKIKISAIERYEEQTENLRL